MRGQATSIQHSHQRSLKLQQQKCLGQAILPTSNPSTNSGRLSHHTVSQGLVSDVSGLNPKHLDASRHIFSSQCIQNRHQFLRMMQTFISSKGYSSTHAPKALREGAKLLATRYRAVLLADQITHTGSASRRPSLAGPCGAQRQSRDSVST
jgi:hypothetical protein